MTEISWELSDLTAGAQIYDGAGRALAAVTAGVQAPNPAMYGTFVANAAALTEPATSNANRHLLTALSSSVTDVADRLRATEESYRGVEETNTALVDDITSALEGSTP